MPLSGIHNFSKLQAGFPLRISAGMTICEAIKTELPAGIADREFFGLMGKTGWDGTN
jgi:hypothetical protein